MPLDGCSRPSIYGYFGHSGGKIDNTNILSLRPIFQLNRGVAERRSGSRPFEIGISHAVRRDAIDALTPTM